ncbi:hypothetical protein [Leisingera sp. ANG-S5]|uniref:hypothetical protein n=1 Tax=Leisingera sp. ANG-S5 TaxID=1577901 RepID=UPI00057E41BE|nr:hypothetical protein [Leisingera sp. ANG-S5]KIC32106.1 hypothetical protein RA25_13665 [Leisingera sp. ANG-S5]
MEVTLIDNLEFFFYSAAYYALSCIKAAYLSVSFSFWTLFVLDFLSGQEVSENLYELLVNMIITPFILAPFGIGIALQIGYLAIILGYFAFLLLLKFKVRSCTYWVLVTSILAFLNMMLIKSDTTKVLFPEFNLSPALVGLAFAGIFMGRILFSLRGTYPFCNACSKNATSNERIDI